LYFTQQATLYELSCCVVVDVVFVAGWCHGWHSGQTESRTCNTDSSHDALNEFVVNTVSQFW